MITPITVAYGNGIGPEIMEAVLYILREAEAPITIETIEIGERVYDMQEKSGILPYAWDSLERTKILLKGPTETPENNDYQNITDIICAAFSLDKNQHIVTKSEEYPSVSAKSYIGESFALFEPEHGLQLDLKGKNKANPSSMLLATLALLEHIKEQKTADLIKTAWQETLKDGLVPYEFYSWGKGLKKLKTQSFAEAISDRLGKTPSPNPPASV